MGMPQRRVASDSSSIILLHKAALFEAFYQSYRMVVTGQVYAELLAGAEKGPKPLQNWLGRCWEQCRVDGNVEGMGRGESSVIILYLQGGADFVLLDDKKGAKYCKKKAIPFINSLLVPRLLLLADVIDEAAMRQATRSLIAAGYYSPQIIKKARRIEERDLRCFLPHAE